MSLWSSTRGRAGKASLALLVFVQALFFTSVLANGGKNIDPSDPSVVAVKEWFETELDIKYNETTNKVVHIEDAQKQVVNGYNYILTMVVKTTYNNETVEWLMHKSRIYEHPPWDQGSGIKFELSNDEVPVFDQASLELSSEVSSYINKTLGAALETAANITEVTEHFEQTGQIEHFSMQNGASVEEIVSHRVYGEVKLGSSEKRYIDMVFVTKDDKFVYFDHVDLGKVEPKHGGASKKGHSSDVKLLTAKTSFFAIFLVILVVCGILAVHIVRKRQKKSKEDWYIEQLTDIDEL